MKNVKIYTNAEILAWQELLGELKMPFRYHDYSSTSMTFFTIVSYLN